MPFAFRGHREVGKYERPSFSYLHDAHLIFSGEWDRKWISSPHAEHALIPKDHDRWFRHTPRGGPPRHPAHKQRIIVMVLSCKFDRKTLFSFCFFHQENRSSAGEIAHHDARNGKAENVNGTPTFFHFTPPCNINLWRYFTTENN